MHKSFIFRRRFLLFIACGLLGLLFGCLFAAGADNLLLSWMRRAAVSRSSILLLLPVCVLPFLISAYAVSIQQWNILFLVTFFRFLGWAFCSGVCIRAFGTAAWLIQPLLQFADNGALLLYGLCGVRWCEAAGRLRRELIYALIGITVTVITDYFIVSPFLASLFSF